MIKTETDDTATLVDDRWKEDVDFVDGESRIERIKKNLEIIEKTTEETVE